MTDARGTSGIFPGGFAELVERKLREATGSVADVDLEALDRDYPLEDELFDRLCDMVAAVTEYESDASFRSLALSAAQRAIERAELKHERDRTERPPLSELGASTTAGL